MKHEATSAVISGVTSEAGPLRSIRLLTALLLVGTFAFGSVTGVALTLWARSDLRGPPPGGPPPFGPLPLHELELSPEQRARAEAIFERHRPALDAIRQEGFPKVRKINEQLESEVRELLTPEQLARLEQLKAQRPPRPPGPPPFGGPPHGFGIPIPPPPGAPPPPGGWPPPPPPPGGWPAPCPPASAAPATPPAAPSPAAPPAVPAPTVPATPPAPKAP